MNFGDLAISEHEEGIEFSIGQLSSADISSSDIPLLINFLKQHLNESANRRSSWRLPLTGLRNTEADHLRVTALGGDTEQAVTAIDISLTGIFIESSQPLGERGEDVYVRLELLGLAVEVRGLIVRQDKTMTRCALQFPDCLDKGGRPNPPEALSDIFYKLEQVWLDKQLTLEWR
ncbi:PilZ domain-containing protein [Parahaliea maris]|nr:PilZ domain-containing protein [Parahaliea maris]